MAWITPKTNWVENEYFNISPDYNRIKGNIEYLIALSKEMYPDYTSPTMATVQITGYPKASFFNNVVNATKSILNNCYSPDGIRVMRTYAGNGVAWNASELNAIENNHLLLYEALIGQKEGIRRLQFKLGGNRFGS